MDVTIFMFESCLLGIFFLLHATSGAPNWRDRILIQDPGKLAREINAAQRDWVAEDRFKRPVTYGDLENFRGTILTRGQMPFFPGTSNSSNPFGSGTIFKADLPKEFDLRKEYPYCKTLTSIRDQSACGSCWAVSSASAFSDRLCIATKGKVNVQISAEHMVACCKSCGHGCDGGYLENTWEHLMNNGEITGGDYNSEEGCQPYSIPAGLTTNVKTPDCKRECTNLKYGKKYGEERYKNKNKYVFNRNVEKIQRDILENGPVVTGFFVYTDFMLYKSGVYRHVKGVNAGGHAVKLIGWGTEDGKDYWLVANSWSNKWGMDGTFRMRRGYDECFFESFVVAGQPDLSSIPL